MTPHANASDGRRPRTFSVQIVLLFLLCALASAQTNVVSDNYNVTGNGTGFALGQGVNSGINPPTTRLTGTAAANLRYLYTQPTGGKATSAYSISGNKLTVAAAANSGRFTLSADGSTPFNFASVLGTVTATPANPAVYEITVSMANNSAGTQRFSFALGTVEDAAHTWDFGLQLYRTATTDNFYTIGKRVDTGSSGLAADLNFFITNTVPGTWGTQINFLIRVTDAGAESGTNYNSRVQLSMDGGATWFYDTATDPDLPNGWRLDGSARYLIWDQAGNAAVTYDDFSLTLWPPISVMPVSPTDQAHNIGPSVSLSVIATNRAPGNLTVTFYGREAPKPFPGPDFCIAVLPDTQNYAREASGSGDAVKEMWFAQTEWIITNRVQHNIVYVAHLGDIVQNGDIKNGNPNLTEWQNATNAMYRLENPTRTILRHGLPYGLAVGNHDQEPMGDPDGTTTLYTQYFGTSRFNGRPYYGGNYGANNDSHFDVFSASGLDFIVLYFEFGRYGSAIVNWANAVLATNQHRRAIVVTHFAGSDQTPSTFSAQGQAIYNALKIQPNFFLMLGGHVFNNGGEGSRSDTYNGRTVRTFISNYQGRMNGGNGWMRLMYFSPSNNLVTIKTYSPWLDQYETDANSQMTFSYNLQLSTGPGSVGTPFGAVATNTGVIPGSLSTSVWSGLRAKTTYDWRVKVTDAAGHSVFSPVWRFSTSDKFTPNTAPVASTQTVTVSGDGPAALTLLASDPDADPLTFQIVSQPLNGLIPEFAPSTGTLVYQPAWGFRGSDRITFRAHDGLTNSLTATLYLNIVAPPDTNANGLPDAWEAAYCVADPNADDDGDGQTNFAEYRANTNPTNAASVFRILQTACEPDGSFTLRWAAIGGVRYRMQYSDGDTLGAPAGPFAEILRFIHEEMDDNPPGMGSVQTFTDDYSLTGRPANDHRYYRIRVVP